MIIFIYGSDSYRKSQKITELGRQFEEKNSAFSKHFFDLSTDGDFYALKDYCGQISLFSQKKLAVLKNVFDTRLEKLNKDLIELIKSQLKSIEVFLIIEEESKPPKDFNFLIKPPVVFQEINALNGIQMEAFIANECRNKNIKLDAQSIKFLAKVFKKNSWGIITTIEMLQNLFENKKDLLTLGDVLAVVDYFEEQNLFSFMDAISKKRPPMQKISLLEKLMISKEDEVKIFNIFASRPNLDVAILEKLARYDVAIKSGKLDYETALTDLSLY